jgi:hypothetical protein
MLTVAYLLHLACLCVCLAAILAAPQPAHTGSLDAVYDLVERVLPGSHSHFRLSLANCSNSAACFTISDVPGCTDVAISASSASELTAGLGVYLREVCNMTIGWPRGGGSNVIVPNPWPSVGPPITRQRIAAWSYIMNVCTHSYSLVWYGWNEWQSFIDWMALSGINMALAMTGQEEIQYKVFTALGLNSSDIETWFNGPAFLTWSRGQNEYGNNIAGPLPRSWMVDQWNLQKKILARYRSLGIVSQLPAFQGNVPVSLKKIYSDLNITQQGDTGWMNSADPLFGKIADLWMQTIIADFGTDHWYQMDGYFNGGTAPWFAGPSSPSKLVGPSHRSPVYVENPACNWSPAIAESFLPGCDRDCESFDSVDEAQQACALDSYCGGITNNTLGKWELRASVRPQPSSTKECSYYITNEYECHKMGPDPTWMQLAAAAYAGITRTDPDAVWSFQGWAIIDWSTAAQASYFSGFVAAVPKGKFVIIDMSVDGSGEWSKWNNSNFFGAPFIWTTLHDFGGTDALKGNLSRINQIPFEPSATGAIGTGYTPEGIDQNPVYYELMADVNFHSQPVTDLVAYVVKRAHRRYGLMNSNSAISEAWTLLADGVYTEDLSVQDGTGVAHIPGWDLQHFDQDLFTPHLNLCRTFSAWKRFIVAADVIPNTLETFRYDLVNTGREVLAQLTTPLSVNFSNAITASKLDAAEITRTAGAYVQVLVDLDTLVSTEAAFLVGPWISAARAWGASSNDCGSPPGSASCPDFYEWNARTQITTWNPTGARDSSVPPGPVDYAAKHWSGLLRDYYAQRVQLIAEQALLDASAGRPLNSTAVNLIKARLAYSWTTSTAPYPVTPQGDSYEVSRSTLQKYEGFFAPYCSV